MHSLILTRWQSLDSNQRQAVLTLQIPQEQIEFAGTVERAIAASESAAEDEVAGLAILQGTRPVGFVVVSRGSKQPDWAPDGSVALTAMRIDSREQGKGLGKAALAQLDKWLQEHWPTSELLALCVDDENYAGRRAYAAAGFAEYMAPKQGRIGIVRYLSKRLGDRSYEAPKADLGLNITAVLPFGLERIDHVVLRVSDIERSVSFFKSTLGCEVVKRRDDLGLVHLRAGVSMIDLVSVQGPLGLAGGKPPGSSGRNMDHLCLRIQPFDSEVIFAFLATAGVKHVPEVHHNFGAEGDGPSIYITDPDGNQIELKGPASLHEA
jgi:catechol 2,3-dioxygenase-like lactoylglutathione lyase family enzyme/RimJ/RimL family protein N-acetyltransferase